MYEKVFFAYALKFGKNANLLHQNILHCYKESQKFMLISNLLI